MVVIANANAPRQLACTRVRGHEAVQRKEEPSRLRPGINECPALLSFPVTRSIIFPASRPGNPKSDENLRCGIPAGADGKKKRPVSAQRSNAARPETISPEA